MDTNRDIENFKSYSDGLTERIKLNTGEVFTNERELEERVAACEIAIGNLEDDTLKKAQNLNDVDNKRNSLSNLEAAAATPTGPSDYGYDSQTQQSKSNVQVMTVIGSPTPMGVPFKDFADTIVDIENIATLEDVNSITAKYITSSAAGAAFADEAALAGDKYYAGQIITTSTSPALGNNDYCIVLDSGASHGNATARYVYQEGSWVFQYIVSQVTLTQAQLDALNSGITAAKVTKLDGIETGAQVNVQADWNETDPTSDKYIENKPTIPTSVNDGILSFYYNNEANPTVTFSANQASNESVNIQTICYGVCSTSASTAKKTVSPPPVNFFNAGAKVSIKFTYANTAREPTLDITAEENAIRIAFEDGTLPTSNEALALWSAGEIVDFIYDGTYWCIQKEFGTEVTLNGSNKKGTTASFYAPTSAGTSGYILKSNGNGAPSWEALYRAVTIGLTRDTSVGGGSWKGTLPSGENTSNILAISLSGTISGYNIYGSGLCLNEQNTILVTSALSNSLSIILDFQMRKTSSSVFHLKEFSAATTNYSPVTCATLTCVVYYKR
jgi:hypothetical protein